jgi:hypothetical protein
MLIENQHLLLRLPGIETRKLLYVIPPKLPTTPLRRKEKIPII